MHILNGKIEEKIIRFVKDFIFTFKSASSICTKQQYLNRLKIKIKV
jgi:hypothetical protein